MSSRTSLMRCRRSHATIVRLRRRFEINTHFNSRQQVSLDFVLSHDVSAGVDELAQEMPTPLLHLCYHDSIADAVSDLGKPDEIGRVLAGIQRYIYAEVS